MRAEAAGDPGPWRQQAILGRGRWDADALRDIVRDYVVEALADADAVLVIDETGFLKQGGASGGVARRLIVYRPDDVAFATKPRLGVRMIGRVEEGHLLGVNSAHRIQRVG